jgi:hypothetical protein
VVLVVRRRGHPAATREAACGFPVARGISAWGVFGVVGVERASILVDGGSIFGVGLLRRADGARRSCSEQMSEKEKGRKRKMYA